MAAAHRPHRRPKLSESQVQEIRENRLGLTMKQQAAIYNVHHRTIQKVRYFKTWRNAT
jgi:DNA-binding transcriptional regulator YiaG